MVGETVAVVKMDLLVALAASVLPLFVFLLALQANAKLSKDSEWSIGHRPITRSK